MRERLKHRHHTHKFTYVGEDEMGSLWVCLGCRKWIRDNDKTVRNILNEFQWPK